jgi:histone H2B
MPAKKAVKSTKSRKSAKGSKRGSSKKVSRSFQVYILRIIRQIHGTHMGVSSAGMAILNSFVSEMFQRIGSEAGALVAAGKTHTMGAREVAAAVRFALPGELGRNAAVEAAKSVAKYTENA